MVATEKKFTLRHIFKNVSQLEDKGIIKSYEEEHFNVPWQISICHKYEHLGVFLHCLKMKDIKAWEINVEFTLKLTTSSGKSSELSCSHIWIELGGWGWHKFISWDTIMKDYLIDNVIIIEATAKITEVTGFTKKALRSFDESNEEFSDVIIAVEDEKFYVLKQFLASHSSHFKKLFLGKCEEEAEKSEYTLQDINSIDFQNLLEVFHGEPAIDEETVQGILDLAEKYDMPFPTRKCEKFLIDLSEKIDKGEA